MRRRPVGPVCRTGPALPDTRSRPADGTHCRTGPALPGPVRQTGPTAGRNLHSEGEKQSRRRAARRKPAVEAHTRRAYAAPLADFHGGLTPRRSPTSTAGLRRAARRLPRRAYAAPLADFHGGLTPRRSLTSTAGLRRAARPAIFSQPLPGPIRQTGPTCCYPRGPHALNLLRSTETRSADWNSRPSTRPPVRRRPSTSAWIRLSSSPLPGRLLPP